MDRLHDAAFNVCVIALVALNALFVLAAAAGDAVSPLLLVPDVFAAIIGLVFLILHAGSSSFRSLVKEAKASKQTRRWRTAFLVAFLVNGAVIMLLTFFVGAVLVVKAAIAVLGFPAPIATVTFFALWQCSKILDERRCTCPSRDGDASVA